jgi:hypothetical protein
MKKATHDQGSSSLIESKNTSAATQRLQILAHLRKRPLNTFELRELGHMAPAPRIKELRDRGFIIVTSFESVIDELGKRHNRVARYSLVYEPPAKNPNKEKAA